MIVGSWRKARWGHITADCDKNILKDYSMTAFRRCLTVERPRYYRAETMVDSILGPAAGPNNSSISINIALGKFCRAFFRSSTSRSRFPRLARRLAGNISFPEQRCSDDNSEDSVVVVVVVVVFHIQRIGCQPEKTTSHGGQSRSWSAEQGKKKVWQHPPPRARALPVRRK